MLVGKKIVLRTLREADLDRLYDLAAGVREMGDHWPLGLPSEIRWKKRFSETRWWEEDHGGLLITDHEDNILGHAVSLFTTFLFETRPVDRIQATTIAGGKGSEAVLRKCGFQFEGVMRKSIFHQEEKPGPTSLLAATGRLRPFERRPRLGCRVAWPKKRRGLSHAP